MPEEVEICVKKNCCENTVVNDGIEHNIPIAPVYKDVLELWSQMEVGYTPTLFIKNKNPHEDIRNSESITHTTVNGRLFDTSAMHQIGNKPGAKVILLGKQAFS